MLSRRAWESERAIPSPRFRLTTLIPRGERRLRLVSPLLTQIQHLREPHRRVGDLPLVDQEPEVGLTLQHRLGDLVERHFDDRGVAAVKAQEKGGRGVASWGGTEAPPTSS